MQGHGEPSDETTPRRVMLDAKRVKAVACGYAHSIALCSTYDVLVWGSGFKGTPEAGGRAHHFACPPPSCLPTALV